MSSSRDLSGFTSGGPARDLGLAPPPGRRPVVEVEPDPKTVESGVDRIDLTESSSDPVAPPEDLAPSAPTEDSGGSAGHKQADKPSKPSRPRKEKTELELTRVTATVSPDVLDIARQVAAEQEIWVSDIIREGLLTFAKDVGPAPRGRQRKSRRSRNFVTVSVVLEPDELAALNKAAGDGQNRSWAIRAVLRHQLRAMGAAGRLTED